MSETKYAWIITTDHLYEELKRDELDNSEPITSDEAGRSGPRNAPAILTNGLGDPMSDIYRNAYEFHMYDDDGELYYTGRLATNTPKGIEPDEDALYAPLSNFGGPNAGATLIKYTNHPNWDMEY